MERSVWEQWDIPSPKNIYRTEAARDGGGVDIHDPIFGPHWTKSRDLHCCLFTDCGSNNTYDCEGHHCVEAQSIVGHGSAAAVTAKSVGVQLIIITPPTHTPSEIDSYNWHWLLCFHCCDVRMKST